MAGMRACAQLVLLRLSVNSGPAVARNVGLAWVAAQGVSVACLMDADCSPGPGWLAAMAAAQAAEPGIVCGRTFACQPDTAVGARPPGARGWRVWLAGRQSVLGADSCRCVPAGWACLLGLRCGSWIHNARLCHADVIHAAIGGCGSEYTKCHCMRGSACLETMPQMAAGIPSRVSKVVCSSCAP